MTKQFERFSVNIVGKPRYGVLEGRDYIVLPVVILVEGVHAGSNGPILYTLEDMKKFSPAWNHKPVVVNHPKKNGEFVSADDPAILSTYKVGILMAAKVKDKKQYAEAWLEKSRIKEVDERVLSSIENGETIEVSTGLFTDNEDSPGDWEGEEYDAIARNYAPDHLALLPDLVGACSVKDGCGMFTAAQAMTRNRANQVKKALDSIFSNEMSHGDVHTRLYDAVYDKLNPNPPQYGYIEEVYDDYFVYCIGDEHYKQEYKISKDEVELVGEAESVERKVVYSSNTGDSDMSKETKNCECDKEVKTLADTLISANKDWVEMDREWLQSLDKPKLEKLITMQKTNAKEEEEEENNSKDDKKKKMDDKKKKGSYNETEEEEDVIPAKKPTVQEYLENAPPEVRDVFAQGLQSLAAERKRYTDIILTNDSNVFTADELKTMDMIQLKKLAKLAIGPQKEEKKDTFDLFSFAGAIGAPVDNQTSNEEALPLPVMNFSKKDK